jgi:diguanylate cyclase (GGDEF)-like protein
VGWMLATLVFCLGGALQPVVTTTPVLSGVTEGSKRVSLLPYAAIAVGFGVLIFSERDQPFFPDQSLTAGAAALAAAVAVRQVIAQRELGVAQSRNVELVDELRHQAFHDDLTGLANRALFTERLEHALTRVQRSRPVAVLMLDLDHFKNVNDTLGHSQGDQLLVVVAERLQRSVRAGDTVARFGGDEFALVLEDLTDPTMALSSADRIVTALNRPISLSGHQVTVSASVGVALAIDIPQSAEELLRDADTAMYAAKQGGRNRYRIYEPDLRQGLAERAQLGADLSEAWARGEISVAYQPIVGLDGCGLAGFEALARWQHPLRGAIPPGVFIPLAEELDLIHQLDSWVLSQACARASSWNQDYPQLPPLDLHVNVAPHQLLEPSFVAGVAETLRHTGLPPAQLTLELTESSLIAETQEVADRLTQLKSLGLRLAIDDFGTGYSSLSYLRRLPIDVLKIDRSFVEGMGESAAGAALVHAILQLGAALGVSVVAEGIETGPQLRQLQDDNCPQGQGFLFSRAMPSEEVDDYIDTNVSANALSR